MIINKFELSGIFGFLISGLPGIFFSIGFLLTIYHAFSRRRKSGLEKFFIISYILILNFYITVESIYYIIKSANYYLAILPFLNLIYLLILLELWDENLPKDIRIDDRSISNKNASKIEIFIGFIIVSLIVFFSNNILTYHWSISLSMLVSYSQFLHKKIIQIIYSVFKIQDV